MCLSYIINPLHCLHFSRTKKKGVKSYAVIIKKIKKEPYSSPGVTSVRANLAVLNFSLRKKEACFLNSWNKGVPILLLLFLFNMSDISKLNQFLGIALCWKE